MKTRIKSELYKMALDISRRTQKLVKKRRPTMALHEIQRIEKDLNRLKKTLHL